MTINQINTIAVEQYGFQINGLTPIAALWLAEFILETTGQNVFKAISRFRNKYGLGTSYPEYGTKLFSAI